MANEGATNGQLQCTRHAPVQYKPDFLDDRYEDGHVFLQVSDTKNINIPDIPKCDSIDHVIWDDWLQFKPFQLYVISHRPFDSTNLHFSIPGSVCVIFTT